MVNLFIQSWKGEAPLWKAFWIVNVLMGWIVCFIVAAVLMFPTLIEINQQSVEYLAVSFQDHWGWSQNILRQELVSKFPLIVTIFLPYSLYSAICVWRCGKNSHIMWRALAIIIVGINLFRSFEAILCTIFS